MQIITAAIIKGGSGKSTTAAALSQAAVAAGKKVLCIDLDPQANCSLYMGADQNRPGSYQFLHGASPEQVIQTTKQGIDVITASPDLATERTAAGSAKRLRDALKPIKENYDYIFIDTPPHIGEMTFNALQASTGLIIPMETDSGNIQGLYQIADIAHQMQNSNPDLSIIGVVLTRYDSRANVNRYLKQAIAEKAEETGAPFLLAVRIGAAIREAQGFQESIYDYAPNSNPAKDYKQLFEMIQGN